MVTSSHFPCPSPRLTRLGRFAVLALVGVSALPRASRAQESPTPDSAARRWATTALHRPFRLCAGGDVTLGTNLDTAWARRASRTLRRDFGLADTPAALLAPLRPFVADANLVLLNVEGAIGEGRTASKCGRTSRNCYAFRQPVNAATALRAVAPRASVVGNVANNHARDAGPRGFTISQRHLARAGVRVTGADTLVTLVAVGPADTVGVLGFYTSSEAPDARDLDAVRRHVQRAAERVGVVIVTMHLGAEGATAQRTGDSTEIFLGSIDRGNPVAFARAALDGGATMVIGHGPHVLRAAEWHDDALVLYSLGNLLTFGPFSLSDPMNRGVIACADVDAPRLVSGAWLRPMMQRAPGVLSADSTVRALTLIDSLSALDFPETGVLVGVDGRLGRRSAPGYAPPR